jgi:hypothetical protein
MSVAVPAAIASEILAMAERDQAMRRSGSYDPAVDRDNTERMKTIVAAIGWPTRSKVGEIAEHAAWLLTQHADHDRAFQRSCLALMSAEPPTEVCARHLAYLEDRIRVAEERPQRYGTQFRQSCGALEPAPIEDVEHLDERRAAVGLEPFAAYERRVRRSG